MNYEQITTMDPFMLLSIVNMKLRDYYSDLNSLCDDMDIEYEILLRRLNSINYYYNNEKNQFLSK